MSGPQLVCPGCQASDVSRLLFPQQSPQGDRQTLQEHLLEHGELFHARGTVGQHVGNFLGRLPATEWLGLEESVHLLLVRQGMCLQMTSLQRVERKKKIQVLHAACFLVEGHYCCVMQEVGRLGILRIFDLHTSKARSELKVVLLYSTNVKAIRRFINIPLADFSHVNLRHNNITKL